MSFGEKVKARLDALEKQVAALDQRLKALEGEKPDTVVPIKRGPGRPKKAVNG